MRYVQGKRRHQLLSLIKTICFLLVYRPKTQAEMLINCLSEKYFLKNCIRQNLQISSSNQNKEQRIYFFSVNGPFAPLATKIQLRNVQVTYQNIHSGDIVEGYHIVIWKICHLQRPINKWVSTKEFLEKMYTFHPPPPLCHPKPSEKTRLLNSLSDHGYKYTPYLVPET